MKNIMNSLKAALVPTLFLAFLMLAHSASAQGKHHEYWKQATVMNLKNTVDMADEAQAEADITKTFGMKHDEKSAWLRDNTVIIRNIRMAKVEIGELKNGTIVRRPVKDTVLSVRFLRLEKFLSANYVGELHALYVANEDAANKYNPAIVFGFDLNGDNSTDWFAYDELTKQHGVIYGSATAQNTSGNQPGATGNVPQGATKLPDGTIMGPGYMITPQGVTLIQQANGSYLTTAQMQGLQQAPPTAPATKADSTERTASFSVNVKQSGDPDLLASTGGFGQAGGQSPSSNSGVNRYEIEGVWYYDDPVTGLPKLLPRPGHPQALKPNEAWVNSDGELGRDERLLKKFGIKYGYDNEGNPTPSTVEKMRAHGYYWGGVGVGANFGWQWCGGGGCYQTQQCYGGGGGPVAYGSSIWGQANCQGGWGRR